MSASVTVPSRSRASHKQIRTGIAARLRFRSMPRKQSSIPGRPVAQFARVKLNCQTLLEAVWSRRRRRRTHIIRDRSARSNQGVVAFMRMEPKSLRRVFWLAPATVVIVIAFVVRVQGQKSTPANVEWRVWGSDSSNSHYSPLDQINASNFKDLKVAWRWKSENMGSRIDADWKVTPLM